MKEEKKEYWIKELEEIGFTQLNEYTFSHVSYGTITIHESKLSFSELMDAMYYLGKRKRTEDIANILGYELKN